MRVLPAHFDPEWQDSTAFPEVRFLVEPAIGRSFEWALTRNQRNEAAGYEPQETESVTEISEGPSKGQVSVTDSYGLAYDLARACLKDIEGAEDERGKFTLEFETRKFLGQPLEVVKPRCFDRLPFALRAEIMGAAGRSASLSAEESSGVGFTSASEGSA